MKQVEINNQIKHTIYYHKNNINNGKSHESFHLLPSESFHNSNGPARIWYNINGDLAIKEYWYNGEFMIDINSDKELKRYIKLQNII